jgi:hypothetical protein
VPPFSEVRLPIPPRSINRRVDHPPGEPIDRRVTE